MKQKLDSLLVLPILVALTSVAHADDVVVGDVTTTIGPNFFLDAASTGGGDFTSADAFFNRDFGINGYDPAGTQITITGIGWASPGAQVLATSATITITHLGADNAVGGGDDTVVGTATDAIPGNTAAGERVWKFTTPMVANISGLGSRFLIRVQGNATIRYKTRDANNQTAADVKLSVSGSFNGGTLPDTDSDGIPGVFETATGIHLSAANTGTNPANPDTDSDGYLDGVENNSGIWNGVGNPGTNPNNPDLDGDGLLDGVETNTGTFVGASNTGTSPFNRDQDNDRLSDGFEVANGLNPHSNANFDGDGFSDALEVLFYGSDPKSISSFPGDGTHPAPGSFTPIQVGGTSSVVGGLDIPATLGTSVLNEAALGGADNDYSTGVTNFALHFSNVFPASGSSVSLTGFAWPVTAVYNQSGDILVQFFDPGPDGSVRSIDQATLVGTARGTLTVPATTSVMYWNFAQPVNFTSSGTGLIVKIQSTAAMRIKADNNISTGFWRTNDGRSTFGNLRASRISLGGTAVAPALPKILSITRTGTTTQLTWDLNGAPSVTLQRSTTLGGFENVPGKVNTTDTSHSEVSADPKAFFRLSRP